ncbi:MAG: LacI family DNA-binding transcriptional regulator [Kiritimatiellae bacterium]|nr:LacI family DNA-binding transcriptional regulator [Kiritimatiellia bacterium]
MTVPYKRISIKDVAEAAGVSRAAVSLVLNNGEIRISDEKRQRILQVAKELNYTPHAGARRLALQKMETIGLIFADERRTLSNLFVSELTHSIAVEARRFGYDILLNYFDPSHLDQFPTTPGRVDGSILVVSRRISHDFLTRFEATRHPHVVIGGGFMHPKPTNFVDVDVSTGMLNATRHLIQNGHRNIGFFSTPSSEDKLNGYIVALTKHRLPVNPDYIVECDMTDRAIEATLDQILAMAHPPTALVTTNDWLAIRIIRFLRERGITVPEDMSITGFDNVEISSMITPPLTTVRVPEARIANLAVEQVVKLIDQASTRPVQVMLPAELVYRKSTSPLLDPISKNPSPASLTRAP